MKKIKPNILIAIILSIFLIIKIATKESKPEFKFSTTKITSGEIVESVVSSGKIIPGEELKVFSRLSEDVYKAYAVYGDIVKKGQILLELDSTRFQKELSTKLKNLEILKIELEQKKKKAENDKVLLEKGYIASIELDESENEYKIKSLEIEELKAEIQKLEQNIIDTQITSPIEGRVDYINEEAIKEGKIFANVWLYTISSGHKELNLSLSIDGREITKINVGQEVTFSVETDLNTKHLGRIIKIVEPIGLKPNINKSPVFYEVIVEIINSNDLLKTGLSVDATINIQTKNNIYKVKRSALRFVPPEGIEIRKASNDDSTAGVIWVLNKDNSISAFSITPGIKDSEFVEISDFKKIPEGADIITNVEIINKSKNNGFSLPQPKGINMSSSPSLELSGINKIYKMGQIDLQVLFDVNLHIYPGDFVSIIGPSGSGKTTLLNILACLDRPTSGVYNFFGEDVSSKTNDQMSEIRNLRIGFIFQSFNLIPRHTALENVMMPLHYSDRHKSSNFKEMGLNALDLVGLSDRTGHYPNELSGGQQQRVAIARALVTNPEIILADEPTGNLDSKTSDDIMSLLKNLNSNGKTVITITHDNEIASQASEIIKIKDGRVL